MDQLSPEEMALENRPLRDLDDAELQAWMFTALRMWKRGTASWLGRWRWQRIHRSAFRELGRRTIDRMGEGLPLCDRCLVLPPTTHVAYGHGAEQRYGHYCDECSLHEPSGWLVISGKRPHRFRSRPKP